MMKYKVLKSFRDLTNNKKLVLAGEMYEHKDPERIKMLQKKGFIEITKGGKK